MAERLFGVETEYALTSLTAAGQALDRGSLLGRLMDLATHQLIHMRELNDRGLFLQNGARFYVDSGLHPEMSTPECANPWDVARYIQAGDRIVAGLAEQLGSNDPEKSQVLCFRCNVDYSGSASTWGCHESYLYEWDPQVFPGQIIPHLVSRLIYTGAGGFNPLSRGIEFTLSPRVHHIVKVVSGESTNNRGIFHTKDESLCGKGYHRLHIICGESLCSETATWLKVGTTALVVAMIDAGLGPGIAVELDAPLKALQAFSRDPQCTATVKLANGQRATALSIQQHYLAQAEAHLRDDFMPPWGKEVCRQWRAILDRLQMGPTSVARTLDWAIKYALFIDRARGHGIAWESLDSWSQVLAKLHSALELTDYRDRTVGVDFILGAESPIRDQVDKLTPYLRSKGLSWDGLRSVLNLRRELFEIDTRFGQLGGKGIFTSLDRAGVLAHRFPGVDNIEHAIAHPPSVGRARLRGNIIRRLAGNNGTYRCDWEYIWDRQGKRVLDLSRPFESEERWRDLPGPDADGLDLHIRLRNLAEANRF